MSLKQPVQYPVKHYSHLDANAPQLANADGVVKTILKACLVTGYGEKEGAGWTSLFEDDFRIVLRRPLRTGNPPDLKFENGVVGGTARHCLVTYESGQCTGLDDPNSIRTINWLTKDSTIGTRWHLLVTDFGFILCYDIGRSGGSSATKSHMVACLQMQSMDSSLPAAHIFTESAAVGINGTVSSDPYPFFDRRYYFNNTLNLTNYNEKIILDINKDELYTGGYVAQRVIIDDYYLFPAYISLGKSFTDTTTSVVTINGRDMLRYVVDKSSSSRGRPFYIPLDYWEL